MPPGRTEFAAANAPKLVVVKLRFEPDVRVARALSEGELVRVGTFGVLNAGLVLGPLVRATFESVGKI